MADFDAPFANAGEYRFPTTEEQANGFPCGPADRSLFNGLLRRIEAELGEVISYAGLTGSNADLTQVRQAIDMMIAAQILALDPEAPPIDTSTFLLLAQARTRLPIFPETQTADGKIAVTSTGSGNIRIPSGATFLHRGIYPVTTVLTDLTTDASKTYHLRWNPTTGFNMNDLAAGGYNPGTLAEDHVNFDSKYDDMLISRIVTNVSNVPTITNLINLSQLYVNTIISGTNFASGGTTFGAAWDFSTTYDWARTPKTFSLTEANRIAPSAHDNEHHNYNIRPIGASNSDLITQAALYNVNRYRSAHRVNMARVDSAQMLFSGAA